MILSTTLRGKLVECTENHFITIKRENIKIFSEKENITPAEKYRRFLNVYCAT